MDGFEKEIPLVVIGASVTGDTPVLVKKNGKIILKPIKEIIDEYYLPDEEGVEKSCPDLEVLGFVGKKNRRGVYFRKAVWQKGVFLDIGLKKFTLLNIWEEKLKLQEIILFLLEQNLV
jgi:hypothetical protein